MLIPPKIKMVLDEALVHVIDKEERAEEKDQMGYSCL